MLNFFAKKRNDEKSQFMTALTMLIFGAIGLAASFVLAIEEFHLLQNPDVVLSCSINLVLNCSAVMQTWQASVFGFPNMFIGLIGFSVVITVATSLLAGAKFPNWFLNAANICFGLGLIFSYWLFLSSIYVIQILCPWCLIVTFATTILFACITHYNLRTNVFGFAKKINKKIQDFQDKGFHHLAVAIWIVILILLVFFKFGSSLFA